MLTGQTILVTGATGGIGRSIAAEIARAGGRPVVHYGRNRDAAIELCDKIGSGAVPVGADLSAPGAAEALWADAERHVGRLHGLVNNAGIRATVRVEDDADAWRHGWEADLQVNLLAPADLTRCAIRHFRAQGGGRIVNIASRAGQRGYAAEHMPYGAAKAGLINLTKSVARNFGAEGIVAVAIAPGFVRTEMADAFVAQHGKEAAVGDIPVGVMVEPAEIAELVVFALRGTQPSLNGATLDVNGGSYLR